MSNRVCVAVLNLNKNDHDGINNQAKNFIEGLYVETVLYADPPIQLADFKNQYDASIQATALAADGGKKAIAKRNKESGLLLDMMADKLIIYINGLYKGNRENLGKSGAPVSEDPSPHPRPEKQVIKRIDKGPEPKSAKVFLVMGQGESKKKNENRTYILYVFEAEDAVTPVKVFHFTSMRKLVAIGITVMTAFWYAVTAQNAGGESDLSDKVRFVLTE